MARSLRRRAVRFEVLLLLVVPIAASAQSDSGSSQVPRTSWGAPDLQGMWDFRTSTPLERPDALAGTAFLSDKAAAAWQASADARLYAQLAADGGDAAYEVWADLGTELADGNRTSLIVEPADGKIPAHTPTGQVRAETLGAPPWGLAADNPEDRPLNERCIMWTTTPLTPTFNNNNIHLLQTPDYVVIYHEMIHDVRVVPLDGRLPLSERILQWRGDARGHWDGDTLVVETSNFHDQMTFFGSGPRMRLTERFSREDANTLTYEFTIDDPAAFTRSWSAVLPMKPTEDRIYDYACHEGNRAMVNILTFARLEEQAQQTATR